MKKRNFPRITSLILVLIMMVGMIPAINTSASESDSVTTGTSASSASYGNNTSFPYNNAYVYSADTLLMGIIDPYGQASGTPEIGIALTHVYTYDLLAEALLEDESLLINSMFWQNLKNSLDADFVKIANWEEEMYVLLIIDYLNYYGQTEEFESNFAKNTIKFTESVFDGVVNYMYDESLDSLLEVMDVKGVLKNQSVEEAAKLAEKYGVISKLKKYNDIANSIQENASTAIDYYKNLTKALSVQQADETRMDFLRQMQASASDNTHFCNAVDKVISMYESSYATLVLGESTRTMLDHGMTVLFKKAKEACPQAERIIDGIKIYNNGLNWLFNSDDLSQNNLKMVLIYTMGSYAQRAVNLSRQNYITNLTVEDAETFISTYEGYLKYQQYASETTKGFVSSILFDGFINEIKNAFSDKNMETYKEFVEYLDSDINFCNTLEELLQKHFDLYFKIKGHDYGLFTDGDTLDDNLIEIDPNKIYTDDNVYNMFISGNVIINQTFYLKSNLTIHGDLYIKSGTVKLNNGYTLTICGNLIQCGGTVYMEGGTLNIEGDYRIQTPTKENSDQSYALSDGVLHIIDSSYGNKSKVTIDGDFIVQSSKAQFLKEGVMEIGGDIITVYDEGVYEYGLCFKDSLNLILTGEKDHHISAGYYYIVCSNLEIQNAHSKAILFSGEFQASNLVADGITLLNRLGLSCPTEGKLEITGRNIDIYGKDITLRSLSGNPIYSNSENYITNVTIHSSVIADASTLSFSITNCHLTIVGDLIQPYGKMVVYGTLTIQGDYRIQNREYINGAWEYSTASYSALSMYDGSLVKVQGDFFIQSSISYYQYSLTGGIMEIGGNFTHLGNNTRSFESKDNHTVVLTAKDKVQRVSFAGTKSYFNILKLTQAFDTGYTFSPENCWKELQLATEIRYVSITNPVSSAKCGDSVQMSAKVVGTNSIDQSVNWSISNNTDPDTQISATGLLNIGANEEADKIIITATSTVDSYVYDSVEISIVHNSDLQPKSYSVAFVDYDNKLLNVQTIKEGESAESPEAPTRKGYNFVGWDTDFKNVTSNLTVKAVYEKIPTTPTPAPTTGSLKVEVVGGTGFTISVDGGKTRPQGAYYNSTKTPIGASITVTANTTSDATFLGWFNSLNNSILSQDTAYTFLASGNDFIKAVYATKIDGVQMVTFKNTKSGAYGRVLDSQYYAADDAIEFPDAPTQVGYDFAGWNMTEAEIQSAIANGNDVTVEATWTRQIVKVQVTVTNGSGTGEYNALAQVTATANEPEEGQKFAYWTDAEGNIKSYSEIYSFFPTQDTEVIAVFVSEDTVIEEQILVSLDAIDTTGEKNVFYYTWNVPAEYDFVKAGIIAVNKDNLSEATFYAGTTDNNVFDRSPSGSNLKPANSWSWSKSNVASGDTWVAKAYVQYRDTDGSIVTVYSDMVEATKD